MDSPEYQDRTMNLDVSPSLVMINNNSQSSYLDIKSVEKPDKKS